MHLNITGYIVTICVSRRIPSPFIQCQQDGGVQTYTWGVRLQGAAEWEPEEEGGVPVRAASLAGSSDRW